MNTLSLLEKLRFAALLHDIGKFWQGAGEKGEHAELSVKFVRQYLPAELQEGITFLARHHESKAYTGGEYKQLKMLVVADWLSSGERRKLEESEESGKRKETPMESLFPKIYKNDINGDIPNKYYIPSSLSTSANVFPLDRDGIGSDLTDYYKKIWDEFVDEVKRINYLNPEAYFITFYHLLKKYTSFVPSAVWKSEPDISLFDHSRMTCAIAECLYKNADERYLDTIISAMSHIFHGKEVDKEEEGVLEEERFLLIGGDISGVQNFIYSITSKGAAKGLKGRSFYLQLLGDAIAKYILKELDLSIANLLYSAGGHFYILAPKRDGNESLYENIERIMMEIHDGGLYLAVAEIPVSARDFIKNFDKKWSEIGEKLGEAKKKKFFRILNRDLFTPKVDYEDVCHSCGLPSRYRLVEEEDVRKCRLCKSLEELTTKVARKEEIKAHYIIETSPNGDEEEGTWDWNLSRFGIKYILVDSLENIDLTGGIVYKLNDTDFIENVNNPSVSFGFKFLLQTPLKELNDLSTSSEGVKKWGVLRGDVDNLGKLFMEGLENPTISRISTLSSMLTLFFSGYMNEICRDYKDKVYGIYSGGDDFFIVGSWSILPELARRIYIDFKRFTGDNPLITLSVGIAIAPGEKYPIYKVAEYSGEALEKAKDVSGKDAITFLNTPIKWSVFNKDVLEFRDILQNFIKEKPRGVLQKLYSIYKLYDKYNDKEKAKYDDRYGRWRWMFAYLLARLDAKRDEKEELKKLFIGNIEHAHVVIKWVEYLTRIEEVKE